MTSLLNSIMSSLHVYAGVRSLQRMCIAVISTFPELPSSLPPTLRAEAAAMIAAWKQDIPTATIHEVKSS